MADSTDYIIRWFREDDLDYYIQHLNNSLYNEYDKERFRWKFLDNPFKMDITPIAMVEEKKTGNLVGFNSFLPFMLNTGSVQVPVVQGCDGYIERNHRRRGLFQKTIHFMTEYFSDWGPELLLGFNFVESLGAAKKAGSISTASVNRWFFEPNQLMARSSQAGDLEIDKSSTERVYEIYKENSTGKVIHLHRTLKYLEWRFELSPLRDYEMYEYNAYGKNGYIIISTIEDENGRTELSIDDYYPPFSKSTVFFSILNRILHDHENVEIVELYTRKDDVIDWELHIMGLEMFHEPRYTLIMKPINAELDGKQVIIGGIDVTNIDSWHLTKSDIY